jgi:hypothetical protein
MATTVPSSTSSTTAGPGVGDERRAVVGEQLAARRSQAVSQRPLHHPLHTGVDRQHHVGPGPGRLGGHHPDGPAGGVDLHGGATVLPPEVLLERELHAGPADQVPRDVALAGARLELRGADLADVAEEVGGQCALRVGATRDPADHDAGEPVLLLPEPDHHLVPDVHRHGDGQERVDGRVGEPLGEHVDRDVEERGQPAEHGSLPVGVERGAVNRHHVGRPVVDEHDAVAGEDAPAWRRLDQRADGVASAGEPRLLARQHLEVPHPRQQHGEERTHDDGQDPEPDPAGVGRRHPSTTRDLDRAAVAHRTGRRAAGSSAPLRIPTTPTTVSMRPPGSPGSPTTAPARARTTTAPALAVVAATTGSHPPCRSTVAEQAPTAEPATAPASAESPNGVVRKQSARRPPVKPMTAPRV